MSKRLPSKSSIAILAAHAFAPLHLLAAGVSKQLASSGFQSLSQCQNDALAVRDCFLDVFQLHADASKVRALTSKGGVVSRGALIAGLKALSSGASPADRVLFFFSGQGVRIGDKLFLAPEDAWSPDEPDALLELGKVLEIVDSSPALQKLIILDVCWCGSQNPHAANVVPSALSKKFLEEYLRLGKTTAVVCSSSDSQAVTTRSPNPKLSLFSYHLEAALRGDSESLTDSLLTLPTLFDSVAAKVRRDSKAYKRVQQPVLVAPKAGTFVFGDFRPILNPASFSVDRYPIASLQFSDWEPMEAKDVLPNNKRWTYSLEHIAGLVNESLGSHLEERLGMVAANLKKALGFSTRDVDVSGTQIDFPDGVYQFVYEADHAKHGRLMHRIRFSPSWFGRSAEVVLVLEALSLSPTEVHIELFASIKPLELVPGLQAAGWKLTSELARKLEADWQGFHLVVEPSNLTFRGFSASELLTGPTKQAAVASGVMALLAQ